MSVEAAEEQAVAQGRAGDRAAPFVEAEDGLSEAVRARRAWMGVLARAPVATLQLAWDSFDPKPRYDLLRPAESGLVMVRGRAGGAGMRFNLGEMTMTRCVVRLASGRAGYGYIAGRDGRHAELAALFDALMQDDARRGQVESLLIRPLAQAQSQAKATAERKAAATKVEFFTLVRGED
jgi:alpha-D-ribose 1-methylphosphonate 5-triphosphate synthase subunit PhnG